MAETLADQKGFGPAALEYARRLEKSLDPKKDSAGVQRRVLRTLAAALNASDKKDEAKEVEQRLDKIPVVSVQAYAGRKGKSDHVVLLEMFTGAQCPPCVTADMAFDALNKTYKPSDVVFLEYHLHIPRPDPLTVPDNEERAKFYKIEGTPTLIVNGKEGPPAGGRGEDEAQDKYDEYNHLLQPLLEKPAKAHLKADDQVRADGKSYAKVDCVGPGGNGRQRASAIGPRRAGNRLHRLQQGVDAPRRCPRLRRRGRRQGHGRSRRRPASRSPPST